MAKRPTPDEQKSLFEATIAAEGITTVAGNVGGTSFEDGGLAGSGLNSFVSMMAVIHPGDPNLVDSRDITAFNNGTGEVTVATAFKGGQVLAGTPYKIVTFRFVPAEVAALAADITALLADVGDASAATLGSLLGILGDPAQTFLAMIGYEGATTLHNKLTAARAALLDEITAARMAELDAANIPAALAVIAAYVDTLETAVGAIEGATTLHNKLTAARAGYLDELAAANLPADIDTLLARVTAAVALASVCTEVRLAELNAANMPADLDTLVARLTAARATNLDSCTYLEQVVPIKMNCLVTISGAGGTVTFIGQGATGASGLISTDDAKVQKVFLLIIGRAVNTYDGDNALDCATGTDNQWQIDLDSGGWGDLINEEADGQMLDNDWRCHGKGIIHPFTFMFDVTTEITNIDGKIGVRLENADAEQDTLIVTCDIYLRVLWKL